MIELLIWFIGSLLSTLGITYLFCKVNNFKKISKSAIILFFIGVVIITLLKYYNLKLFATISYFIFYPILFYFISKFSIKKLIINTLILWLIGVAIDLVAMILVSFFSYIFKMNLDKYYDLLSISLSLVSVLFFIIIGYFKKSRKILNKTYKYLDDIEYSNLTLVIFCAFIFMLGLIIFLNFEDIHVDVLIFIIIILSVFTFILLVKYRINAIENKKYLETLRENNDFYIKMDDENRIFKHNLMAKLSSIKSVSNKKAIALIDDFVIKTNKTISYSKKIKRIPYGLNGIIYQRTYPYLEDINFNITNKIDFDIFKVLKPRRYNVLVEKLFVSLDNAIEASLNSKNKVVVINLYDDEENIYIEIKNSFSQKIDIDNLGSLNYSTKGKKRGLGLFSILRDNEASVNIKIVNNYFISIISARKQK